MTYSGNSHRVQLFLSILGLPYERIDVDPRKIDGSQLADPQFGLVNPFLLVPVIIDGDVTVYESTAILTYLARKYGGDKWLPDDPIDAALVQQWFSFCAGPIAHGPCAARRLIVYDDELVPLPTAIHIATEFFSVIEPLFASRDFAIGDRPTLADIAAYAYIAHAPEGGLPLDPYPNIRRWLTRIEALPGFVPMPVPPAIAARHGT
jgi:glutathione S-transferase